MKSSLKVTLAMWFVALGVGCAHPALAWWNSDFAYRKEVVLDTAASGGGVEAPVQNIPVLLRLDTGNFTFDDARPDGADLRFVAEDDHTVLTYSIESFDPKLGLATVWIDVPSLAAGSQTRLWMYFGNKKAVTAASSEQTLDPQFRAVYHFGAGESAPQDATLNHNHLTTPVPHAAGWIGEAARLDGTVTLALPAANAPASDAVQGFTFEAWIKPHAAGDSGVVYSHHADATALVIGLDHGVPYVKVNEKGAAKLLTAPAALPDSWSYLAVTGNAQAVTVYVNGEQAAVLQAPVPALPGSGVLGGDSVDASAPKFAGALDEIRLSAIARSAAYVKANFASAGPGARLVHLGPTQQPAENGFGYFGIVFKNVTLDAWVVIAILCLMGLMSWAVMWQKATYVGRTARANSAFLTYYRRLKGEVLALDSRADMSDRDRRELGHSSLYRLYRVAVAEIRARREEDPRWVLTEEALEAVRASLDATQVEEVQALDRGVVLLTISIAGAPFIGLLGTVLGVMITFAAIAASGEVNVNSIAPGIAAALLATVTGLAVAIPALFGYNYISARNSDVSAKMQVFVDQLITRVAELQRRAATPRAVA